MIFKEADAALFKIPKRVCDEHYGCYWEHFILCFENLSELACLDIFLQYHSLLAPREHTNIKTKKQPIR